MFRLGSTIVVLAAAGSMCPQQAGAHAILMESQPAISATIQPGPTAIVLRFNSRVDHARSRLALRARGAETALPIDPASPPDSLATTAALQPGDCIVRWQVLAVDGHITRGDIPLIVRAR